MPPSLSPDELATAKAFLAYLEAEQEARKYWDRSHRAARKLVKTAKLGRKSMIVVRISENRGVRITDEWRSAMREKSDKIFTKAYCRRHEIKEVSLD